MNSSTPDTVNVKDIEQGEFDRAIVDSKGRLVVVEFYTSTCPNCAAMVPVYEEVAGAMENDAVFYKVNANENQGLAMRFGIMGVPAFKFFCKGQEVAGIVGSTNVTALTNTVKDMVKHGSQCVSKSSIMRYEMDGYG